MSYDIVTEPSEIEKKSFEIITEEMNKRGNWHFGPLQEAVVKRVIHTTADFSYLENLTFSKDSVERGCDAILRGATIVSDTNMVLAGINKTRASSYDCDVRCFIADDDVATEAKRRGVTRARVSMQKAAQVPGPLIFAIGNAPTALFELCELIGKGRINPELVIGVPVGFVNVVESKEAIMDCGVPFIVSKGRKGGSTVVAAICNALLYSLPKEA